MVVALMAPQMELVVVAMEMLLLEDLLLEEHPDLATRQPQLQAIQGA